MSKNIRYFIIFIVCLSTGHSVSGKIKHKVSTKQPLLFEMVEFEISSDNKVDNPFTDQLVKGEFVHESGNRIEIDGFCDSEEGSLYKLRFLPVQTGTYQYVLSLEGGPKREEFKGKLYVASSDNKGLVRIDSDHPSHFIWEGTGEHYFWNGTTTYWLMGWKDEVIIKNAIDRLASLDINRIRVAISGRQDDGQRWYEPMVKESKDFTFLLNPWVAKYPESLDTPEFNVTRFNTAYWQKLDRLVEYAQKKGIVVSLIFYVDGLEHGCDPFKKEKMGGKEEKLYYRYAAARYSAFTHIMWDVANEYHLFRTEEWVEQMGKYLYSIDPYKHLISVHGHASFPFRNDPWVNMVLYQSWDECGGYEFMMRCRKIQEETKRVLPQINEEYGYEDHYPPWGCGPEATKEEGGRSGDNRRQLAWEIYMAGGYQTTGERANEGTGAGNDSGGGWINGRGNDSMTMLEGYAVIKRTFKQLEYWKLKPMSELVNYGNLCLAEPGKQYLIYSRIQHCRLQLPPDQIYSVQMVNARTGEQSDLGLVNTNKGNRAFHYPKELKGDWAFILKRIE